MIVPFPSPQERLERRIHQAMDTAHRKRRQQLTVTRSQSESSVAWAVLMDQLEFGGDIRVVQITDSDALLSWRHHNLGAAS